MSHAILAAGIEDAAALAELHAACFPRPWSRGEIGVMLAVPGTVGLRHRQGMCLCRVAGGQGEILTIGVIPEARGRGIGDALLHAALEAMRGLSAEEAFLEVRVDNVEAARLYRKAGFVEIHRRKAYYTLPSGERVDGVLMRRALA